MRRYKPPIKDEDRDVKNPERARKKTFDRAINLLTFKQRSVEELRARLLEKKWTNREIVEDVIARLSEYNYLNDEEFAGNLARAKLRGKPIGKRKLEQDLRNKKLSTKDIDAALEIVYTETPEDEVIDAAIEKRLRIKGYPHEYKDKQNFFGYLARLGFDYDLIRHKLNSLPQPDFDKS
ncbi:MAG: regulatory protein RecX [Pyrinomonadaceae bacterium]